MFVKQLKEHDEALAVVRWLKQDVLGIVEGGNAQVELSQITDSFKKLEAYTHLFNAQAMKDFAQLTQGRQDVSSETAEWDAAADDNDRSGLSLNRMGAGTEERDVGHKLLEAIDRLEQHLINSMEDLKRNEVQAAWDLVRWLQGTEQELVVLDEDQATKTTYMDRLLVAIIGAKAREDEAWEIYFESAATLNDALADREAKRAWYAQEKARRDEENAVLDEVIRIFIERVSGLDSGMRNKVNDFSVDGMFQDSDISRSADAQFSHDSGRLQSNLESETRG
jgi:DNA invertase Pin-like site-specific DNA recombinase